MRTVPAVLGTIARRMPDKERRDQDATLECLRVLRQGRDRRVAEGPRLTIEERAAAAMVVADAKRSLKAFVYATWDILEPDEQLVWNWHLDELVAALEGVTRGEIKRLLVNVPPGTMKSLLVSVFWPAWEWFTNGKRRYLTASYDNDLTIRDNLRLRDIVESAWYKANSSMRLSGDQNAKERFDTTEAGWRIATSVGGRGTGEHPDRVIIDDPHTAANVDSEKNRTKARRWFRRTISTRGVARGVAVIVIMQRLHQDDLSAFIIAKGTYVHICLPMEYVPTTIDAAGNVLWKADPRDHRTVPGELLWPAKFSAEVVAAMKIDLDQYGTAGQLQQQPAPEGGGMFKRSWFPIVDAAPVIARRMRGWDTAATEGAGDWTVGVKIAEAEGIFYIEDVRRGRWSPADVDVEMQAAAAHDGRTCGVREEQEPGASGKTVVQQRARTLVGYDYRAVSASGDKATRAKPFRAQAEAGNVRMVRGPWNEAYISELSFFPNGSNDDQVDGSSCSFNELNAGPRPVLRKVSSWG